MTRARNSANLASHGNLFVDITNDRTGIGSVVPAQNLHVAGTAGFHADTTFVGDLYNTIWDRSDNSLKFGDNSRLKFGNTEDALHIYHDSANVNYIISPTNRQLQYKSDGGLLIRGGGNQMIANFLESAVTLYKGQGIKLTTVDHGINVTGTTDTDGLVVSGVATVTTMNVTGVLTYDDVTSVDSIGIVTARQGIHIDDSIVHIGDTNTKIRFPSDDTISFETAGSERLRIESGGDVGIGTDNPHKRLHVAEYGTHGAIRVEGSGNGNRSGIEFYRETSAGVGKGGAAIWVESDTSSSTGKLRFGTASNASVQSQNTDMILDHNGRLGIGTDNPSGKLDIQTGTNGNVLIDAEGGSVHHAKVVNDSGDLTLGSRNTSADTKLTSQRNVIILTGSSEEERIRIDSSGRMGLGVTPTGIFDIREDNNPQLTLRSTSHADNGGGRLNFALGVSIAPQDGNTICSIASTIHSTSSGTLKGDMKFYTNSGDNLDERLRIDSSGFVGLDNTSPNSSLAGARNLVIGSGSGDRGLTIMSGTSGVGHIEFSDGTGSSAEKTAGGIRYYHNSNYMRFNTNGGSEKLRITSGGTVNIGGDYTNTTGKLKVTGDTTIDGTLNADDLIVTGTSVVADLKSTNNNNVLGLAGNNSSVPAYLGTDSSGNFLLATGSGGSLATRMTIKLGGTVAIPSQGASNANPRLIFESSADSNDFTFSQYEDSNGVYTLIGQNLQLSSGGNTSVLDSGHKTAGILFDGRNNGAMMFLTGGTNTYTEALRINSSGQALLGAGAIATTKVTQSGSLDLDSGGISLCIGGDENSSGRTNSTNKLNRVVTPHYTNAEEPMAMISGYSTSSQSELAYGGGSGLSNAVTVHHFYTAANTTTTTGTERLRLVSDGKMIVGEANTSPVSDFEIRRANNGGDVSLRIGNNTSTNAGSTASLYFTTSPTQNFNTGYIQAVRSGGKLNFGYSTNAPTVTMKVSTAQVGINTDTFNDDREALRVQAPVGQTETFLTIKSPSNSGKSNLFFGDNDFNEGRIQYDHSDDTMQFFTVDQERLRITAGGNIFVKGTNHELRFYRDDNARFGAITYDGGNFTIKNPVADNTQVTKSDGTLHTRFENGGDLQIHDGNLTILASGQGINFHNYGSGTNIDSNLLDDYEEGTFTAHFSVETQGNMTMSNRFGKYIKIGKVVTVIGGGQVSGNPSGKSTSHAIQFTNLPFTAANTNVGSTGYPFTVSIKGMTSQGIDDLIGNQPYTFIGRVFNNGTNGRIEAFRADGSQSAQNASEVLQSNTEIAYMFTYIAE